MKPSSGNPGINKLARVMQQRMQEVNKSPLLLDFGVIQDDYSLLTNTFPIPIPKTDYLVCRDVTHDPGKPLTQTKTVDLHSHDVVLPESMRWLKPGDRVLVAWVQNDAVVIDIVLPATKIGG
jgi:hypothetical protein